MKFKDFVIVILIVVVCIFVYDKKKSNDEKKEYLQVSQEAKTYENVKDKKPDEKSDSIKNLVLAFLDKDKKDDNSENSEIKDNNESFNEIKDIIVKSVNNDNSINSENKSTVSENLISIAQAIIGDKKTDLNTEDKEKTKKVISSLLSNDKIKSLLEDKTINKAEIKILLKVLKEKAKNGKAISDDLINSLIN